MNEVDRAEFIQGLKAYLIPSSLFISCLLGAAGTFLLANREPLGYVLFAAMLAIIGWAFWAFIHFQNKLRAGGRFKAPAAPAGARADEKVYPRT